MPSVDPYEAVLLAAGVVAMLAAVLPGWLSRRPMSLPIVLVLLGAIGFSMPLGFDLDLEDNIEWVERSTELGVIVSLMGAGLKLDRPVGRRTWSTTWRLLAVAMPVTIALVAVAGAVAGLAAGSAVLVGAALAPTDPVLASEVQVGEPSTDVDVDHANVEDEVRFSLTSEAGLNDGLAFPFVYLAITIAAAGGRLGGEDLVGWVLEDLVLKLLIALVAGVFSGWVLAHVLFGRWRRRTASTGEVPAVGFVALASTLITYGFTEMLHGYGFLAVFVCAVTIRSIERSHEYVTVLHTYIDEFEQLIVVALLVLFGGGLVTGLLRELDWWAVAVAGWCVFVARPVSCRIALWRTPTARIQRRAIEFFGIRGIGSLYYVAYAVSATDFVDRGRVWAFTSTTVLMSIVVHGVVAGPAMQRLDRYRPRRAMRRQRPVAVGTEPI